VKLVERGASWPTGRGAKAAGGDVVTLLVGSKACKKRNLKVRCDTRCVCYLHMSYCECCFVAAGVWSMQSKIAKTCAEGLALGQHSLVSRGGFCWGSGCWR
jgi:hypothetical protein